MAKWKTFQYWDVNGKIFRKSEDDYAGRAAYNYAVDCANKIGKSVAIMQRDDPAQPPFVVAKVRPGSRYSCQPDRKSRVSHGKPKKIVIKSVSGFQDFGKLIEVLRKAPPLSDANERMLIDKLTDGIFGGDRKLAEKVWRYSQAGKNPGRKPTLGSGARFKALVKKLRSRKGRYKVRDAKRLAAWIGRKKYGSKKMQRLAAQGKWRGKAKSLGALRRKAANPPMSCATMALAGVGAYLLYKYVFKKS